MADRDLPAEVVRRALEILGCEARFDGNYLKVSRRTPEGPRGTAQHLHKGKRDILRRGAVRTMYRHKLGFTEEEFYRAVSEVE